MGARIGKSDTAQSNVALIHIKNEASTSVIINELGLGEISSGIMMPIAIGKLKMAVICTNLLDTFLS
ncbi:hypothetical protein PspMM1_29800 [Pseudoalteromonas sp. MM1]|jgi:hypothetical protein|nr:hypothetical protein PspMM1_29800 [Pseudoalteromonas sp. MM1]